MFTCLFDILLLIQCFDHKNAINENDDDDDEPKGQLQMTNLFKT